MGTVSSLVGVNVLAFFALVGSGGVSNEDAKLTPSDGATFDAFGPVAVSGVTAVVGASGDDELGASSNTGSAYVFTRLGATWTEQAKLTPLDAGIGDLFGSFLSISNDSVLIGAPGHSSAGAGAGTAYVFGRAGTTWNQVEKLVASDAAAFQSFGSSVSIADDTAVVGAKGDNSGTGAAYVFTDNGSAWVQVAKLGGSGSTLGSEFGNAVSVDGDTAIIAAHAENFTGSAYAFVRQGTSWVEQQLIKASDVTTSDTSFGNAVAVDGDTAVVGAWRKSDVGNNSGAAYVFVRDGTSWSEQQKLSASDASAQDHFGTSVAISGDRAVIGAFRATNTSSDAGAVYLFVRDGETWTEEGKFVASDGVAQDWLGTSASISGETILAGAPEDDDNGTSSGSVYVFSPEGSPPSFCDAADGALASCPCGNLGGPEAGCDLQQGTGGVGLTLIAQRTTPSNGVTWTGTGYPPMSAATSILMRAMSIEPTPVVYGDGLRCVGVPIVRLAATSAFNSTTTHSHGHGTMAGSGEFHYQLWFRNAPIMFCDPAAAFNLSNGRTLIW
jgi:hypothetical protein